MQKALKRYSNRNTFTLDLLNVALENNRKKHGKLWNRRDAADN